MKVELFLIVGIVFFCCWCAYIIIRMNLNQTSQETFITSAEDQSSKLHLNNKQLQQNQYQYQHNQNPYSRLRAHLAQTNQDDKYQRIANLHQAHRQQQQNQYPGLVHNINSRYPEGNAPVPYWAQSVDGVSTQTSSTSQGSSNRSPNFLSNQFNYQDGYIRASFPDQRAVSSKRANNDNNINNNNNNNNNNNPTAWPVIDPMASSLRGGHEYLDNNPSRNGEVITGRWPIRDVRSDSRYNTQQLNQQFSNWRGSNQPTTTIAQRGRFLSSPYRSAGNRLTIDGQEDNLESSKNAPSSSDRQEEPADPDGTLIEDSGEQTQQQSPEYDSGPDGEQVQSGNDLGEQTQPREELEERAGRRSFSEEAEDANERDRFGKPVISYHRHLINGRPIKSTNNMHDPQTTSTLNRDSSNGSPFDRVVDEIEGSEPANEDVDSENEEQESVGPGEEVAANNMSSDQSESRMVGKRVKLKDNNDDEYQNTNDSEFENSKGKKDRDGDENEEEEEKEESSTSIPLDKEDEVDDNSGEREPENKKEVHKHDMKESLKAQQWDDDATSNPGSDNRRGDIHETNGKTNETDTSDMETTTVEPSSSDEMEFKDLDLLADPNDFPFMEGNRRRKRKKRDVSPFNAIDYPLSSKESLMDGPRANYPNIDDRIEPIKLQPGEHNISPLTNWTSMLANQGMVRNHTIGEEGGEFGNSNAINIGLTAGAGSSMQYTPPPRIEALEGPGNNGSVYEESPSLDIVRTVSGQPSPINFQITTSQSPPSSLMYGPDIQQQQQSLFHQLDGQSNGFGIMSPFTSGSKSNKKKVKISKKKKKKKKGYKKKSSEKAKSGKGLKKEKSSKFKKGGMKKKKHKAHRKMSKGLKQFQGSTKGLKGKKGEGNRGAKKGALFYKDKGYKKKGFKKAYQKLESGDHKTYFDEFRDKNHKKKWKNFKDKHRFSQNKKWSGKDKKRYDKFKLDEMKDKSTGVGGFHKKAYSNKKKDYKYNESMKKKKESEMKKKKKKKKKIEKKV